MADYNSMSNNKSVSNEPAKEPKKIISGNARVKKRPLEGFLADDINSLLKRSLNTVVIPYIKRSISDTVNILMFGESGGQKGLGTSSQYSYNNCYGRNNSSDTKSNKARRNYEAITFDTVDDAERVVKEVQEEIGRFGIARVAYMYECAGITCDWTLENIGWNDISGYQIIPCSDGWRLKMPKAQPINK